MSLISTLLIAASLWAAQSPSATKPAPKSPSPTHHSKSTLSSSSRKRSAKSAHSRKKVASYKKHGQQKIDSGRAQQIQEALIREHYLSGQPSGVWDSSTERAMQKFQADNGWQSKTTPDSRALIKLGLGPDHDHLLNPESAMTGPPQARTVPPDNSENSNKAQP